MLSYTSKKSILSFFTSYIYSPSMSIYNYFTSLYNSYYSDEEIKVDIESKTIEITFWTNDKLYKIKTDLVNNNLKEICQKLEIDIQNELYISQKTYLSAIINDDYDITDVLTQYSGPFGDFYQRYGLDMKVDYIVPTNLKEDFQSLKIIDDEAEIYEFNNLNDILRTGYNINWFNNLSNSEKIKTIKKCPYI
ncbi:uncharacterized protein METZ01_LOCUS119385 [marine metagenome]|uniref:Uncharacterized protein n=1 Tax=marine metagenome TaxID=408172 RepID=A0A381XQ53_9ZZZZ